RLVLHDDDKLASGFSADLRLGRNAELLENGANLLACACIGLAHLGRIEVLARAYRLVGREKSVQAPSERGIRIRLAQAALNLFLLQPCAQEVHGIRWHRT